MRKVVLMLIMLRMGTLTLLSQPHYAEVRFTIPRTALSALYASGIDIDHGYYSDQQGTFTTVIRAVDTARLPQLGYQFKVNTSDVVAQFNKINKPSDFYRFDDTRSTITPTQSRLTFNAPVQAIGSTIVTPTAFINGGMGGYYTLAEMKQKLDDMVTAYPNLVRIDTIGYSFENKPLWMVKISDNVNTNESEAEMLYTGLHHAREPNSMMNLIFFMQYLLEQYSLNARVAELVNNRQLFFIPCMNPDGYEYNRTTNPSGGGMHRKNRSNTGGSNGVDLNRNYTPGWGYDNTGSSPTPSSDTYRGTVAFSEKETLALRNWLRTRKISFTLNHHSFGETFVIPPSCPCLSVTAEENKAVRYIGVTNARYNFYIVGTDPETVGYSTNGVTEDFLLAGDPGFRPKILGATPESGTAFWPTASQIIPVCKDLFYGNFQSALIAGGYAAATDRNSIAITSLSGNLQVTVQRLGLADSSVRVTLVPLENITSGSGSVTIGSLPNYLDTITRSIPYTLSSDIQNGQRIRYVWRTECAGITTLDTITAYYNPIVLFTDDMEGALVTGKWTTTGWGYTSTTAYAGSKSLTESPSGNYGSNATLTATCNTALDLTGATNALLSFRIRYNSQNGFDKLQVQTSPTGATYTAQPANNTVAENKGTIGGRPAFTGTQNFWSKEVVNLSSLLNNPAARFRFQFTSNASTVADGFYIDDVEVIKTNAVTLPVRNLQLSGKPSGDVVRVEWQGEADEHHDHFIVERSEDGHLFYPVSDRLSRAVYVYADHAPLSGVAFYRVRQVDQDGQYLFSNTIRIEMRKSIRLVVSPVPATATLAIQWAGMGAGAFTMRIADAAGRMVAYRSINNQALGNLQLGIAHYAPGLYYVLLNNAEGDVLTTASFIKK